jgi:hypothetical protein
MSTRIKKLSWRAGVLCIGAIVSSCGGRVGAQNAQEAFTTVGRASGLITSIRFGSNPTNALSAALPGFSAMPSLTRRFHGESELRLQADSCGFSSTPAASDLVDADHDGIPAIVNWTFNYNKAACGGNGADEANFTFKGAFKAHDLDDSRKWPGGGFSLLWDFSASMVESSFKFGFNGSGYLKGTAAGNSFLYEGKYSGDMAWQAQTKSGQYYYAGDMKYSITPEDADPVQAVKKGKAAIQGEWTYSGSIPTVKGEENPTLQVAETDISFTATSKNLAYDDSCASYWKTGSFYFDVGGGHLLEARYDCTSVSYFYDGKDYSPPAD